MGRWGGWVGGGSLSYCWEEIGAGSKNERKQRIWLRKRGLALPSLGALPSVSIALYIVLWRCSNTKKPPQKRLLVPGGQPAFPFTAILGYRKTGGWAFQPRGMKLWFPPEVSPTPKTEMPVGVSPATIPVRGPAQKYSRDHRDQQGLCGFRGSRGRASRG